MKLGLDGVGWASRRVAAMIGTGLFVGAVACAGSDDASSGSASGATGPTGGADDDGSATAAMTSVGDDGSADATAGSASASGGTVDCAEVEIPGCDEVVEVCEGGQCECVCGDPAGSDGGGECPPILPAGACEATCDRIGAAVECGASCCGCAAHEGDAAYWVCGSNAEGDCPAAAPAIGERCDTPGASCWYCDDGFVFRGCSDGTWGTLETWTCPG